jgi:1,4-dihydroxy-2-naphthoate octaprenyltransferase
LLKNFHVFKGFHCLIDRLKKSQLRIYFLATRPAFLTASAAPVLVGSALGFATTGTFCISLFLLALFAMMLLHSGANVANDYYDHIFGNDQANKNPTPFSGGSRFIQDGIMSPKATLLESIILLAAGGLLGIIIVIQSSPLILVLGIVGLLGGFFYTAGPIKLSYRGLGEVTIAFLFGILPVTGSYYLQTGRVDYHVVPAALITALLIFLIIFINEFPDIVPDASVGKKTLVVRFGVKACAVLYRAALALTYLVAAASLFFNKYMFYASIAYLLTLPLGINVFMLANPKNLTEVWDVRINARTIILHAVGALALIAGFIVYGLAGSRP